MRRCGIGVLLLFVLARAVAAIDAANSRYPDSLKPAARALLDRADARRRERDFLGAIGAYMQAVKVDPQAAGLKTIEDCAPAFDTARDEQLADKKRAALRQYLGLRPDDWEAAKTLAVLADLPEAESILGRFVELRHRDPDVYTTRGRIRKKHSEYERAIADFKKASELDPQNPLALVEVAFTDYDAVTKAANLSTAQKRNLIDDGLAEIDRIESLGPLKFGPLYCRSKLLGELAALETEPDKKNQLIAQSNAAMQQAKEGPQQPAPALRKAPEHSLAEGPLVEAPAAWQQVTSNFATYEYRLPPDWQKNAFNSYRGTGGEILEQVYPGAAMSPDFCRSIRTLGSSEEIRESEIENRSYDNGGVRGCFIIKDVRNVKMNKAWRHTSFFFGTTRGVEELTLIEPQVGQSASNGRTIIDSVRTRDTSTPH